MIRDLCGVSLSPSTPRLVAEISNAHNGSFDRALRLIAAAKVAGCDFVKLQCYTPDELVALRGDGLAPEPWGSDGWTMHNLYEHARTPLAWFPALFAYAHQLQIPMFSSVFGPESLDVLESCGCQAYKIARLDNQHQSLIEMCRATGKPVIVSADILAGGYPTNNILLACPPGYPQTQLDLRSYDFRDMGGTDGFSYHGTDPLAPVIAASCGAALIEFHLHLKDEPSALETNISLTEVDAFWMAQSIRRLTTRYL